MKNLLRDKLEENYDNLTDFWRRSGIKLSMETCRRAIYEQMPVTAPTLLMIAKHLGYSNKEIRDLLKRPELIMDSPDERLFAKTFRELMSESDVALSETDRAVLSIIKKIAAADPANLNKIADYLDLIAKSSGIEAEEEITKIRRRPGRRT